jgi:hypothetical protein
LIIFPSRDRVIKASDDPVIGRAKLRDHLDHLPLLEGLSGVLLADSQEPTADSA